MKTSNTQRSRGDSGYLIRALMLGGALFAGAACSAPSVTSDPIPVASASTVEKSADQVGEALSEVSLQLSAQMTDDEDLTMAWSDFESDVRSVVNDLISRPSRVDVEGMQHRVEGLEELLDDSALEMPVAQWDEFVSAFQALIREASSSSDSA